jgi:hypothetical protein
MIENWCAKCKAWVSHVGLPNHTIRDDDGYWWEIRECRVCGDPLYRIRKRPTEK